MKQKKKSPAETPYKIPVNCTTRMEYAVIVKIQQSESLQKIMSTAAWQNNKSFLKVENLKPGSTQVAELTNTTFKILNHHRRPILTRLSISIIRLKAVSTGYVLLLKKARK